MISEDGLPDNDRKLGEVPSAALEMMMDHFKRQTPSAPDWYRVIDTVVGTLLELEIERQRKREESKP